MSACLTSPCMYHVLKLVNGVYKQVQILRSNERRKEFGDNPNSPNIHITCLYVHICLYIFFLLQHLLRLWKHSTQ